jgi:flagellar hook-associated protein 3 FlgL
MSVLPLSIARVSNLMQANLANTSLNSTQAQLLTVENELSTGKSINQPSDNPAGAATILQLNQTLSNGQAYASNLTQSTTSLSQVDTSLGNLEDLLNSAQSTASANVGSDVSAATRAGAAATIDSLTSEALTLANSQLNGQYLFGGDTDNTAPFVQTSEGIKYVGSTTTLSNTVDENTTMSYQVNGNSVFGALSSQVQGTANLSPSLTSGTQIIDLDGARGMGVSLGDIQLSNGTTTATVDLAGSDTMSDVITKINAAAVGGITASIGTSGNLVLTGSGTDNITVTDEAGGTTAADLGIATATGAGPGVAVTGTNLAPQITDLTPLADLNNGTGIDLADGITITNGAQSATVKFSSPPLRSGATVEDMLNAINSSGTNVRAEINSAGTGINILNEMQGTNLSISENGGTTAADLGVRSFSPSTTLSSLNGGTGVQTAASGNDFQITDSSGTSFQVSVAGDTTVQDVLNTINTDATAAGAKVTAGFATTGNGITLTDSAGGSGTLTLSPLNSSDAAADLGLTTTASSTGVITGTDVNPISAQGIFGDLQKLSTALTDNDQAGITAAAAALQSDYNQVTDVRGSNGATLQELQDRQTQLTAQNTATQSLLSNVQDANYTTVISQFETLQTALQAGLEATSKTLQMSLLDFLE